MTGPQINALELDVVGWDGQLPMLDLVFLVKKLAADTVFISPREVGCGLGPLSCGMADGTLGCRQGVGRVPLWPVSRASCGEMGSCRC